MPSDTAMVLYSMGVPPAALMPAFTRLRQSAQVEVAGHDFDPGVGDADDRARQVLVGKSNGFQHRAGRRSIGTDQQIVAYKFQLFRHDIPL